MISPGKSIEGTRAEVRCPDPSSNTYLAFAAMIAAGLDGVERGLEIVRAGRGVACSRWTPRASRRRGSASCRARSARRSTSWRATRSSARRWATTCSTHYVNAKRAEWDEYRTQVTGWELDRYLEAY